MSLPVVPPQPNRGPIPYSSIATAIAFNPPIGWVQVTSTGSGGLVVKDEGGTPAPTPGSPAGRPSTDPSPS